MTLLAVVLVTTVLLPIILICLMAFIVLTYKKP